MSLIDDIGSIFGGGSGGSGGSGPEFKNPATNVMPYLKNIPQYFLPYFNMGQDTLSQLHKIFSNLSTSGGDISNYNHLAKGFHSSPGYQYNVNQATDAANAASAAGGGLGSPSTAKALAGQISGMASQDFGNYMNSVMGMQGQGLQGLSGLNTMGYEAGNDLARNQQSMAMLQYMAQAMQNAFNAAKQSQQASTSGGLFGDIAGLAGSVVKSIPGISSIASIL